MTKPAFEVADMQLPTDLLASTELIGLAALRIPFPRHLCVHRHGRAAAAFAHALITSPLRGEAGVFGTTPPNFLKATAFTLRVICYPSFSFIFVRLTNDPTEPCPPRSGTGAATAVLGQLNTLQLSVSLN